MTYGKYLPVGAVIAVLLGSLSATGCGSKVSLADGGGGQTAASSTSTSTSTSTRGQTTASSTSAAGQGATVSSTGAGGACLADGAQCNGTVPCCNFPWCDTDLCGGLCGGFGGEACTTDDVCCTKKCDAGACVACAHKGAPCTRDTDCCVTSCINGICP